MSNLLVLVLDLERKEKRTEIEMEVENLIVVEAIETKIGKIEKLKDQNVGTEQAKRKLNLPLIPMVLQPGLELEVKILRRKADLPLQQQTRRKGIEVTEETKFRLRPLERKTKERNSYRNLLQVQMEIAIVLERMTEKERGRKARVALPFLRNVA